MSNAIRGETLEARRLTRPPHPLILPATASHPPLPPYLTLCKEAVMVKRDHGRPPEVKITGFRCLDKLLLAG